MAVHCLNLGACSGHSVSKGNLCAWERRAGNPQKLGMEAAEKVFSITAAESLALKEVPEVGDFSVKALGRGQSPVV